MSSIQSLVEEKWKKDFDKKFPRGKKSKPEYEHSDTRDSYSLLFVTKEEVGWRLHSAREEIKLFITDLLSKQREEIENIIKDEIKLQEFCLKQTVISDDPKAVIRHSVAKNTYIEALKKIQSNK